MKAEELIALLFLSRDVAHRAHLATRSYAKHKALDGFYHGIVDLADSFAETYQGCYGMLGTVPIKGSKGAANITDFLKQQVEEIEKGRAKITDETTLQNIIDEIVALYYSTIYKLKFLA